MMKKHQDSLPWVLGSLQVCGALAMAAAVFAVMVCLSLGAITDINCLPATLAKAGLWLAAWGFFLALLGRIRREPTACTKQNTSALGHIGLCVGGLGAVQLIDGVVSALRVGASPTTYQTLLMVVRVGLLPLMLFGVMTVALVLRSLLLSAMALQQEADLTI